VDPARLDGQVRQRHQAHAPLIVSSDRDVRFPGMEHVRLNVQLEAIMGLMDVLRGMQYGPRGQPPSRGGTGSGTGTGSTGTGMSPMTMAILGLLAYKALRSMTHHGEQPAPAGGPPRPGGGDGGNIAARGMPGGDISQMDAPEQSGGQMGGRVGDLLKGAFGGLLGGSAAGGIMSGGLSDLLKQLQKSGFADTADSWVGSGPNKTIAPGDLAKVLGADQIEAMVEHSGLSRQEVLDGLSKHLPEVIDQLTPHGKVPRDIPM
jgi:uncharacterized protein YidB (DUF937 family)